MDKKDIYEHLARIYLDASSKRKKKTKAHPIFKIPFLIKIAIFFVAGIFLFSALNKNKILFTKSNQNNSANLKSEFALNLQNDIIKINFNFNPAKKEIYSIDLGRLDLAPFKALGFSVRKANYQDNISLRVEFASAFKEKSEIYFKDIPYKWQDYRITLSLFKNISNWSKISRLSFIVEEWNAEEKKGVIYIDNIRFLR